MAASAYQLTGRGSLGSSAPKSPVLMNENIDLNLPAFGEGSQKIAEPKPTEEANAQAEAEAPAEEKVEEEELSEEEADADSTPIKYSRFRKFHQLAREKEQEAQYWREEAERLRSERREVELSRSPMSNEMPSEWREMYGDSDASKRAWQIQLKREEQLKAELKEEALRAVREEQEATFARTEKNLETIDDNFGALAETIGRELTTKEESAILDIVDDMTPKDRLGNYAGPLISFEKAWEYYEMKKQLEKSPTKTSRDSVAALSGSRTQGEPSKSAAKNENFDPLDWDAWKRRL